MIAIVSDLKARIEMLESAEKQASMNNNDLKDQSNQLKNQQDNKIVSNKKVCIRSYQSFKF